MVAIESKTSHQEARWVGGLRGAMAGTAYFVEETTGGVRLSAHLGAAGTLALLGTRDAENAHRFTMFAAATPPPHRVAVGFIEFEIDEEGRKHGTWALDDGTQGIIDLVRAEPNAPPPSSSDARPDVVQTQLWNKSLPLGAITLYRDDIYKVVAELESHVPKPHRTTIRVRESGADAYDEFRAYLARSDLPRVAFEITISCEQLVTPGFRKIASVNLSDQTSSQLVISSPDELWTEAASSRIEAFLRQYTSGFTGTLRRHGLNINLFILLGVLIWMPDHPFALRLIALTIAIVAIMLVAQSHKLIPYTRVYLNSDEPKRPFARELPTLIWTLAAGLLTWLISSVPRLVEALNHFIAGLLNG